MTNSYKKEYPFVGYAGFGGGVGALSAKSAASKPYVDDVFSTYLYKGNASARSINNGIDLSGKGGMVWTKMRDSNLGDGIFDTVRGKTKSIFPHNYQAEYTTTDDITSFNSNGFSLGSSSTWFTNRNNNTYASWTFRRASGFFDVVTYDGNGTGGRQISHSLGCVPGLIMVKCTSDGSTDWRVFHRSIGNGKALELNGTDAEATNTAFWNDTDPTSTHFTVGTSLYINGSSKTYVAYLFADGGTTATAINFNSSGQKVDCASNSDFAWGTGDYTIECYIKIESGKSWGHPLLFEGRPAASNGTYTTFYFNGGNQLALYSSGAHIFDPSADTAVPYDQWNHVALVRSGTGSNQTKLYINGTLAVSGTDANNYGNQRCAFGPASHAWGAGGSYMGQVTSYRVAKQAIYTSNFTPTYAPLTLISQGATASDVKLLCAKYNDPLDAEKKPTVLTGQTGNNGLGTVQAVLRSDSESSIFGEDEDKDIIKCGGYDGSGLEGLEISLGWEPQYILIKRTDGTASWAVFDCMRGIVTGAGSVFGYDPVLQPDLTDAEYTTTDYLDVTPTGFRLIGTFNQSNASGSSYIYMAIRRPDGYVGKPATTGTNAFAMDLGNASSTIPTFDSGFPVDFAMMRTPSAADPNFIGARLTGVSGNKFNASPPEASSDFGSQWAWDSNAGWCANSNYSTSTQSWMWKRGPGFDVVAYEGNGVSGRKLYHSLGSVPKMMIVKTRTDGSIGWAVYHVGLNGGSNPEQYYLQMPGNDNAVDSDTRWDDTAPTATHFTVGDSSRVNLNGSDYLALLFGDVTGISKCGYYTGDGTSDGSHSIDVGFFPRFILIKQNNGTNWKNYVVMDTLRGVDEIIYLNADTAQSSSDLIDVSSTGWSFKSSDELVNSNENSNRYVYYAHA